MNRRDQELLDKQTRGIVPSAGHEALLAVTIAAVFFAGVTFGGYLFSDKTTATQIVANDGPPAAALLGGARTVTR